MRSMLEKVKAALRLTVNVYDEELMDLIQSAMFDLKLVGINSERVESGDLDPLVRRAIITYCRFQFGSPSDYDKLKASYDEQKAQLISATGYGMKEECCGD